MVQFEAKFMAEYGNKEGNSIVRQLLALGVSQYRIAKDLPISREQVKKWLRGYASPNDENLARLRTFRTKIMFEKNLDPFKA